MENLIFLFHFLRLTLLHYIYPNPRLSFHFFILFWLLCAFYYCKSLLPTIGRLDPRVPPDRSLIEIETLCQSWLKIESDSLREKARDWERNPIWISWLRKIEVSCSGIPFHICWTVPNICWTSFLVFRALWMNTFIVESWGRSGHSEPRAPSSYNGSARTRKHR